MSEHNLCMGCMSTRDLGAIGPCPVCGFDESAYKQQPVVREGVYLPLGTTLLDRQYILGRVLGHGGLGIAYLALDEAEQSRVAIKEYLPRNLVQRSPDNHRVVAYSDSDQDLFSKGLECFLEEARKLLELQNLPGLASVKNYFFENGTGYLVMDYLEGQSLESYLELLGRPLAWEEALLFIKPVLFTLKEIHAAGMIHGDVCPEKIFVCNDGMIRLLGFSAAQLAYRDNVPGLTVVLKPGYTPLEQYSRKGGYGPYTDIYMAAATLYRMLAGTVVPEASERLEKDPLPLLLEQKEGIPEQAPRVLLKALALSPGQRYASIDELLSDLEVFPGPAEAVLAEVNLRPGDETVAEAKLSVVDAKMSEADAKLSPTDGESSAADDNNDLLPSGYEAVMNNIKAGAAESNEPARVNVYKRRKIVLSLIVVLVALMGLGAGNLFYTRYPQEVSAVMDVLNGLIQQFKFW